MTFEEEKLNWNKGGSSNAALKKGGCKILVRQRKTFLTTPTKGEPF